MIEIPTGYNPYFVSEDDLKGCTNDTLSWIERRKGYGSTMSDLRNVQEIEELYYEPVALTSENLMQWRHILSTLPYKGLVSLLESAFPTYYSFDGFTLTSCPDLEEKEILRFESEEEVRKELLATFGGLWALDSLNFEDLYDTEDLEELWNGFARRMGWSC